MEYQKYDNMIMIITKIPIIIKPPTTKQIISLQGTHCLLCVLHIIVNFSDQCRYLKIMIAILLSIFKS